MGAFKAPIFVSMYEKTCVQCSQIFGPDGFYTADKKCKICRRAMVKAAREANADHYKEFDRQRANDPARVAARAAYAKTEAGMAARRRASDKWIVDNKTRHAAHTAVHNALRDGLLQRHPCEVCGNEEAEGHHPDYSAHLSVVWLCVKHHSQLHKEHRKTLRELAA